MNTYDSLSLKDIIRVFFSHKIFFIIFPLLFAIMAYVGYELNTPKYFASVKMLVKGTKLTESDFYKAIYGQDIMSDHAELLKSNIVVSRVVDALKLYEVPSNIERQYASPIKKALIDYRSKKKGVVNSNEKQDINMLSIIAAGRLQSQITVDAIKTSNLFKITVADYNPAQAFKIVNSLSRSYIIFDLEQQVEELKLKYGEKHSTVIQLENYILQFMETLDGELIKDMKVIGPASIKIIAQSEGAYRKPKASKSMLIIFAMVGGMLVAIGFAASIEFLDSTLRKPHDIISNFEIPFLGSIPKRKKKNLLIMSDEYVKTNLSCVNAFQRLGDQVLLTAKEKKIKSLLVTSITGSEDSSALVANLVLYLSRDIGKRVLAIDANLKDAGLSKIFKAKSEAGIIDMFEDKVLLEDAVLEINKNLHVLTSKSVDFRPIKMLDTPFMSNLINEGESRYDIVLVDCNVNMNLDSDPVILAAITDAVIVVINEGKDTVREVQIALDSLRKVKDILILTVLNNRKEDIPSALYKRF
jgi:capsular polysaccharide biosynthesis protein